MLLWNEKVQMNFYSFSLNLISGTITDKEDDQPWGFAGIIVSLKNITSGKP